MSTLFGQMPPREITAIKMKMPIAKSFERHHEQLQNLTHTTTDKKIKSEQTMMKSPYELTIQDIRNIFRS